MCIVQNPAVGCTIWSIIRVHCPWYTVGIHPLFRVYLFFRSMSMRIVSLIPSGTEIVALLGAEFMLEGRSHECDFPVNLSSVPKLTTQRTHFDPELGTTAKDIDAQVAQSVQ